MFPYTRFLMTNNNSSDLATAAITAALANNWGEALSLNQQIIDTDPKNVDALNRLARAYFELGNLNDSRKYYELSLENDPYNQIAFKFLKKIDTFNKKSTFPPSHKTLDAIPPELITDLFIEEPGKTRLVNLLKVAEPQKLSVLSSGEMVNLVKKNRIIVATDQNGEYLGVIPDDLSMRLIKLMQGGNKYRALIKSTKTNGLTILIREVHRSSRFRNQPSFLDNLGGTMAYSSDHIVMAEDIDKNLSESEEDSNVNI